MQLLGMTNGMGPPTLEDNRRVMTSTTPTTTTEWTTSTTSSRAVSSWKLQTIVVDMKKNDHSYLGTATTTEVQNTSEERISVPTR